MLCLAFDLISRLQRLIDLKGYAVPGALPQAFASRAFGAQYKRSSMVFQHRLLREPSVNEERSAASAILTSVQSRSAPCDEDDKQSRQSPSPPGPRCA
jgi:hypothetical protein